MLHVSYVAETSLCGVKAKGIVRASCIVIAVSACWLINRVVLARTPHGTRASVMIITGGVMPRFLVDHLFSMVVWLGSGWTNAS